MRIPFLYGKGYSHDKAKFKQNRTKMKNVILFLTFSSLLLAASCGKENTNPIDTAKINLSFRATFKGEPLVLEENTYDYDGNLVRFTRINFYISDMAVVNNDGETELSEIQFIDLTPTHRTPQDATTGTGMSFSNVPVGTYNQLKFGVGVAADLNKTNPSDYSTMHPLGVDNSSEYWEAWDSYIFAKIEGQYDADGNGQFSDVDDFSFAYHTGGDLPQLYPIIEFDNNLVLRAGETTDLSFELDIFELFDQGLEDPISLFPHDPFRQIPEMLLIMNNFPDALQLK